MTVKEYLQEIQRLNVCINQRRLERAEVYSDGLHVQNPERQGANVKTVSEYEPTVCAVLRLARLDEEIAETIHKLQERKHRILDQIQALDNPLYIAVLHKRYVELKRLERIAAEMNYSYRYIRKVHSKALQSFEDAYGQEIAAYEEIRRKEKEGTQRNI